MLYGMLTNMQDVQYNVVGEEKGGGGGGEEGLGRATKVVCMK